MMEASPKIVFLFSGQGSQYRAMGEKLFQENSIFRNSMEWADAFLHPYLYRSIIEVLYEDKSSAFEELLLTHPAIVAIELAMLEVMKSLDIQADFVAGNSLGEFAAAVAKGVWTKEAALEAAVEQARSFVAHGVQGGMLAVINGEREALESRYTSLGLFLASDNFDEHFTLSGPSTALAQFAKELDALNITYLQLPVQFPFHSPLLDGARSRFELYLSCEVDWLPAQSGFISGYQASAITHLPKDYFWQAVRQYSSFPTLVKYLEEQGPCWYIDLGPSGTMATFTKYNLSPQSHSSTFSIITPFKRGPQQLAQLQEQIHAMPRQISRIRFSD